LQPDHTKRSDGLGTVNGSVGAALGRNLSMMKCRTSEMENKKIDIKIFSYLVISFIASMILLFFSLNLVFSVVHFFKKGFFSFTWETVIDCFILGIITGPIAALGIWLMLRFKMR
jgi:hypothetical protein